MSHHFYISKEGFDNLKKELDVLNFEKMPSILDMVSRARAQGDLRENGEYQAAKQLQRVTNERINYLNNLFKNAKIIEQQEEGQIKFVRFLSSVSIQDEFNNVKKFKIVGEYEADAEKFLFSINSPLVKACIGRQVGDIVAVKAPSGEKEYEIILIE